MRYLIASILFALPGVALASEPAKESLPAWMTGAWSLKEGDRWGDEYWTPPRGGMMIGAAREGEGAVLTSWESTRIAYDENGKLAFWAMPRGAPATRFGAVDQTPTSITFTNPAHDYPQRIRYWRDGKLLKAEVSLLDGSKAIAFTYAPMGQ